MFFFISLCLIVTRFVMNFNTWYKVETVEDCVFKCVVYHYAQTGPTNLAVRPPCNYDGTMVAYKLNSELLILANIGPT